MAQRHAPNACSLAKIFMALFISICWLVVLHSMQHSGGRVVASLIENPVDVSQEQQQQQPVSPPQRPIHDEENDVVRRTATHWTQEHWSSDGKKLLVSPPDNLDYSNVRRHIDLSDSVIRINGTMSLLVTGLDQNRFIMFAMTDREIKGLSYFEAFMIKPEQVKLNITGPFKPQRRVFPGSEHLSFFKLSFEGTSHVLFSQAKASFSFQYAVIHGLDPLPKEIAQSESQMMLYTNNVYFNTNYRVRSQITTFTMPSHVIESYTDTIQPVKISDKIIKYGPYKKIEAYMALPLRIHYEMNVPFITIRHLRKDVEISHWGDNIAVKEDYIVANTGAKFKGSFNRWDYQRSPNTNALASFRTLVTAIPPVASNIYFRDVTGNISSSAVRLMRNVTFVELSQRFPVFGGWKTEFRFGYDLPASSFIGISAANPTLHVLSLPFTTGIRDAIVDQMELRVTLPEGALDVKFHPPPYNIDDIAWTQSMGILDLSHRPVVVVQASKLVVEHLYQFQVTYHLPAHSLWREPLMLICTIFSLLFIGGIVASRLDFGLVPKDLTAEHIQLLLLEAKDLELSREDHFNTINSAISNAQLSKCDKATFVKIFDTNWLRIDRLGNDLDKVGMKLAHLRRGSDRALVVLNEKVEEKKALLRKRVELLKRAFDSNGISSKDYVKASDDLQADYDEVGAMIFDLINELS